MHLGASLACHAESEVRIMEAVVKKIPSKPVKRPTQEEAEAAVRTLLAWAGDNPDREGLRDTPKRVVKAWDELTAGYRQDPADILATDFAGDGYDEMVVCRNIEFCSTCEHHMLPFIGNAF